MRPAFRAAVALTAVSALLGTFELAQPSAIVLPSATHYFHGTPQDQANKAQVFANSSFRGTATFDQNAPTGAVPITQTGSISANHDFVGNPLTAYWRGPFSGTAQGAVELKWYWSVDSPTSAAITADLTVSVFADPEYVASRVQPQHLIGRTTVKLSNVSPTPKLFTSTVPVNGTVASELMIQVAPSSAPLDTGLLVHYDSVSTPSSFRFVDAPFPVEPTVTFKVAARAYRPEPCLRRLAALVTDERRPAVPLD